MVMPITRQHPAISAVSVMSVRIDAAFSLAGYGFVHAGGVCWIYPVLWK
jgi:hypothetical protein